MSCPPRPYICDTNKSKLTRGASGALGFQSAPTEDFLVPLVDHTLNAGPQGVMGKAHYERGLQWVETFKQGKHVDELKAPRTLRTVTAAAFDTFTKPVLQSRLDTCSRSTSLEQLSDICNGCWAGSTSYEVEIERS